MDGIAIAARRFSKSLAALDAFCVRPMYFFWRARGGGEAEINATVGD